MANKLAHLVIEGTTYDIQDEELTNKFDGMTIELSLSNDYVITATLKDGNDTTLGISTIDLPIENSIVSLGYDTTTNEIIGIYRDDTVSVPHQIRVALSNLQEKLTAGQNISITNNTVSLLGLGEASTETVTGIATLDSGGKVPSSQLPSYVDDVLEYSTLQDFPEAGEAGKIYVALDTNLTYRWSGSVYVEISQSLALGETSSTAYRGDRGKTAYDHAAAKGSAYQSGLYKITTNSEGHVTSAIAVQKSDITALGIPAQDTTYNSGVATEIDNTNNVNVKYDSDTLEVDNQNRLKVKSPSQTFNFNEAIENVNGTVNVRYKGGNWNIGRDSQTNQLTINGKFVKQVEDLDAYTDAPDGEIVEYIGDTNNDYTNGYFYKRIAGETKYVDSQEPLRYKTINIPSSTPYIEFTNINDSSIIKSYQLDVYENEPLFSYFFTSEGYVYYAPTWYNNSDFYIGGSSYNVKENFGTSVIFYLLTLNQPIQSFYEHLSDLIDTNLIQSGYRENTTVKLFTVVGFISYIRIRITQWYDGSPVSTYESSLYFKNTRTVSEALEYATQQLANSNRTFEVISNDIYLYNIIHKDENGEFVILSMRHSSGGSDSISRVRKFINENGEYEYLYNNSDTVNSHYFIRKIRDNVFQYFNYFDADIELSYNQTYKVTTEAITLTIPELYDENDNYLKTFQSPAYWQRIDVQPIGVQSYNDLSNKPLSVVNGEVKYTLSDGTTQLPLAQKSELATVATSGSYNDLTDKPTIPTSYNDLTDKPVIPTITFRQWNTTE